MQNSATRPEVNFGNGKTHRTPPGNGYRLIELKIFGKKRWFKLKKLVPHRNHQISQVKNLVEKRPRTIHESHAVSNDCSTTKNDYFIDDRLLPRRSIRKSILKSVRNIWGDLSREEELNLQSILRNISLL